MAKPASHTGDTAYPAEPPPPYYSGPPPPAPPGAYGPPPPEKARSRYHLPPHPHSGGYPPQQPAYPPYAQQQPHPYATAPPPSSGPAPITGQETLHIYSSSSGGSILATDKSTQLYTWHKHCMSKPHITLSSTASGGSQIGTATFHTWSSKIDLVLHGHQVTMTPNGTFKSGHQIPSLALSGGGQGSIKWKNHGSFSSQKDCTDGAGRTLATFERSSWAVSKVGKLHLVGDAAGGGGANALREEILLSLLVEIEVDSRNASAGAAAGASSGGAGA